MSEYISGQVEQKLHDEDKRLVNREQDEMSESESDCEREGEQIVK